MLILKVRRRLLMRPTVTNICRCHCDKRTTNGNGTLTPRRSLTASLVSAHCPPDSAVHSPSPSRPDRLPFVRGLDDRHSLRTQPRRCTATRRRRPSGAAAPAAAGDPAPPRILRPRAHPIDTLAAAAATALLAAAARARALALALDRRRLRTGPAGFRARLSVLRHGRQSV